MSREAQFPSSDTAERGERVRYAEALAVFEDMHRALKGRVSETPEHRALEGLDAALALVASSTRADYLDLDGFSAFRGSVELLNDNTPEARALELFEGALRGMIASASDFDDLPDVDEEDEDEDDQIAAANDSDGETADTVEDAAVIVTIYDASAEAAPAADDAPSQEATPDEPAPDADASERTETTGEAPEEASEEASEETAVEAEAETEPAPVEIQQRIEELEAELAAARAHHAA